VATFDKGAGGQASEAEFKELHAKIGHLTLENDFIERVLGSSEIFDTDQGSQFTSKTFTAILKAAGVTIIMDGKGRWLDNVFIERLWRTIKYEEIYLRAYNTSLEEKTDIFRHNDLNVGRRLQQALDKQIPLSIYHLLSRLRKETRYMTINTIWLPFPICRRLKFDHLTLRIGAANSNSDGTLLK